MKATYNPLFVYPMLAVFGNVYIPRKAAGAPESLEGSYQMGRGRQSPVKVRFTSPSSVCKLGLQIQDS